MKESRTYTVEIVAFSADSESIEVGSRPMSLKQAFYRRNRAIRTLADANDLDVRTAQIVDERGGRF